MRAAANFLFRPAPVREPGFASWLFTSPQAAWIWLPVRLYVGWAWFEAGRHKIWPESGDSWLESGAGLRGFWERAAAVPDEGRPAITYDWYRDFLQYMIDNEWYEWFSILIAVGEIAVGIALIIGAFVGLAAFFGTVMNFNFMLAGTASTNPVLFGLAIFLVLAWRTSGTLGLDRWLLPLIGTPWDRWQQMRQRNGGGP